MNRINEKEVLELCKELTPENFTEKTTGLPIILRALLASKIAVTRVATLEVDQAHTKAAALVRMVNNGNS